MSALRVETSEELESLEDFRQRARSFIRANLRKVSPEELRWERNVNDDEAELATIKRDRELQRMLFDAGLAGICRPRAYGGQGLAPEHQQAFNEEIGGYEYPRLLQVPTLSPCAMVILEFGTEEQKLRHIPAILRGEELWMQFLSEPSGGRRGGRTHDGRARRGPVGAQRVEGVDDRSLVVGLGAVSRPDELGPAEASRPDRVHAAHPPAQVEVHRIEMNQRLSEFCQEFMTDVIVPDTTVSGRRRGMDGGHPLDVPRAHAL